MRPWLLMLAVIGQLAQTQTADACSWSPGPNINAPNYPWWSETGFPTNGLFLSSLEWESFDGPLVLVEDPALSARLGMQVRRSSGRLVAGRFYHSTECHSATCDLVVAAGPDLTPPSRAEVARLRTLLVRDPSGAGGFSCPDVDSLEMVIAGSDDTTPEEYLAIGAYVGATPEEVRAKTTLDLGFGYDLRSPGEPPTATIYLGEAVGRKRDGEPFRAAGPFCFAVAIIDWAGNIGERSEVQCLDTTNPDDPTVEFVEGSACGCRAPATPGGIAPFVIVLAIVFRRRRR